MPMTTLLDMPQKEQGQMRAALRRARYGYLLALHGLLLCAARQPPSAIAAALFCSRSSVYRIVRAYRAGTIGFEYTEDGTIGPPVRTAVLTPAVRRSLLALLQAAPRAYGWCRTRWSCATLAVTLGTKRRMVVSAETVRRWLHEVGGVWKRAKLGAKDTAPHRLERLARIRWVFAHLQVWEALIFADALAMHWLPKVGAAWMPKGTQLEVMTPGQNAQHSLAGGLDLSTGKLMHCLGARKTNALFRELLDTSERTYPAAPYRRLYGVVDNDKIHKAKAVLEWLDKHPRIVLVFLPTYGPRANPIERACGDVHDKCTRNHMRKRLRDVLKDVQRHLQENGPWRSKLSQLYYEPDVTAVVETMTAERLLSVAA